MTDADGVNEATEAGLGNESSSEASAENNGVESKLNELTADLQRLSAEYANYRKRVERDRAVARDSAVAEVLTALLPVLDDFGRAREHDELNGAFKSVSDAVDGVVQRFGLETFGAVGEDFDPALHEAMTHQTTEESGDVVTVVTAVYQSGFRHAGRVLRPARVAVEDIVRGT
jgi:molecular chaperone GrpE